MKIFLTLLIFSTLSACKSFEIPLSSFKKQFADIDSSQLKVVKTRGPSGKIEEYPANPIVTIKCIDKSGKDYSLKNSPSIETRVTTTDNKRMILYFDRIYVQNDTLIGYRSRFIGLPKRIPLIEIIKIEVQDGKKDFHYVN